MIGVASERSEELLPLRVRLRGVRTIDEETERRDHQPGWQIHLTDQEICPKKRSHPCHMAKSFSDQSRICASSSVMIPSELAGIAFPLSSPINPAQWPTCVAFSLRTHSRGRLKSWATSCHLVARP